MVTFGQEGNGEGEREGGEEWGWMAEEMEKSRVISEFVTDMGEKMSKLRKQVRRFPQDCTVCMCSY